MPVTSYSRTPSDNNAAPPNGWPEGMAPSAVNNCARQLMTDVVNEAGKGQAAVLASVAGTNTITASMTPDLDAYAAGMRVIFTPANTNTGATTLNIDGLGALDVQKFSGTALVAGDLVAGIPAYLVLDSGADDWILINPIASTAKYADATANFTGTLQYGGIEVGYRGFRQSREITGSDSTSGTDAAGIVYYTSTGGHTFTADTDPSINSLVTLLNVGSGNLTIAGSGSLQWYNGSGSVLTGSRTLAVGGIATLWQFTSGAWKVWGTGIS